MRKTYRLAYSILGVLLAAPILVSLIQHVLNIGLAPNLDVFVTSYRNLITPIFGPLYSLVSGVLGQLGFAWTYPAWLPDLHALSFVCAAVYLAGHYNAQDQREAPDAKPQSPTRKIMRGVERVAFAMASGLFGLGLFWSFSVVLRVIGHWVEEDDKLIAKAGWATIAAVAAFYGANYLLLRMADGVT